MQSKTFVGIDSVQVDRFVHWIDYSNDRLLKIFFPDEIAYARSNSHFFAARLSVRFAAREAFLKALQQKYPEIRFSLLKICRAVSVTRQPSGAPVLKVDWGRLGLSCENSPPHISLSLTHTRCHATAILFLAF
jgi:phosphopantetheine--protein transferase-like protein